MGIDSVNLSTRTGLGSIYNQWKYAINNKKTTDNFKTYLLSSQEHLNQLECLFTDYGHVDESYGDTFVKESIVELSDGRLLCMDPNEAKAYILDLNSVNSSSQQYNLTVIQPEDTSISFSEQITNLINKITTYLGADSITNTKDGTKIDSSLITGLLSGETKTNYCDEMGIVDTSETDNTYTSGALKLVSAKGITDITSDSDEYDYYKYALAAQGVEIESNGTVFVSGSTAFITNLNNTINDISKIINKGSTATDQDKLNLLQTIRKMSTIEYELLEKMNPGFTQALNTFIGDFQSRTYLDRNGNQSGMDTTISYETVMQEKLNGMGDWTTYLSASDRAIIDKYCNGQYYYNNSNGGKIVDITDKENEDILITKDNIKNYISKIIAKEGLDNSLSDKVTAATSITKTSTAYKSMETAISNTVTYGVSDSTIEGYKDDIAKLADKNNSEYSPDRVLEKFITISNLADGAEILARLLEDQDVVDDLKQACQDKGTLSILDRNGNKRSGELYDSTGAKGVMEYNVENILNHLECVTKSYYSNKLDSTSAVNSSRAIDAIEDGLYNSEVLSKDASDTKVASDATVALCVGGGVAATGGAAAMGIAIKAAGTKGVEVGGETITSFIGKNGAKGFFGKNAVKGLASGWTGFGQCLGVIGGAALGAMGGLFLANNDIQNSAEAFTGDDGQFRNGKANACKWTAGIAGTVVGGLAAAGIVGLVSFGGAIIGAAILGGIGLGIYQAIKNWA